MCLFPTQYESVCKIDWLFAKVFTDIKVKGWRQLPSTFAKINTNFSTFLLLTLCITSPGAFKVAPTLTFHCFTHTRVIKSSLLQCFGLRTTLVIEKTFLLFIKAWLKFFFNVFLASSFRMQIKRLRVMYRNFGQKHR